MVERTQYGLRWRQEDYDHVREALEDVDDVSVNGAGSKTDDEVYVELDIGNYRRVSNLGMLVDDVFTALRSSGMNPKDSAVKAGYRGATNQALLLDVVFEEKVYQK